MTENIWHSDGTMTKICDNEDFSQLLYQKMGADAQNYFDEAIQEEVDKVEYLKYELDSYASTLDSYTSTFAEVKCLVKELKWFLENERYNKKKVIKQVDMMLKELSDF